MTLQKESRQMQQHKIIKAELLITRRCNFRCKYCGIIRDFEEVDDPGIWRQAMRNLKMLGCEFVPIYGAEPLCALERLCVVLDEMRRIGLKNTVITNGVLIDKEAKKKLLDSSLDSITLSIDSISGEGLDPYSKAKSERGIRLLLEDFKDLRDREASVTVTKKNFRELPDMVKFFSDHGVWVSLDVIHYSKGQEGSKCTITQFPELNFTVGDMPEVREVFQEMIELKKQGYLIHPSMKVLEMWLDENYVVFRNWICNYKRVSWITVDCDKVIVDGKVEGCSIFGCDDFQPESLRGKYPLSSLTVEKFEQFKNEWKNKFCCPGCFWSTHVMSDEMVDLEEGGNYFRHEVRDVSKC